MTKATVYAVHEEKKERRHTCRHREEDVRERQKVIGSRERERERTNARENTHLQKRGRCLYICLSSVSRSHTHAYSMHRYGRTRKLLANCDRVEDQQTIR